MLRFPFLFFFICIYFILFNQEKKDSLLQECPVQDRQQHNHTYTQAQVGHGH